MSMCFGKIKINYETWLAHSSEFFRKQNQEFYNEEPCYFVKTNARGYCRIKNRCLRKISVQICTQESNISSDISGAYFGAIRTIWFYKSKSLC